MMHISIVTDEVSSDLNEALHWVKGYGIDAVELRGVGGQRVPDGDMDAVVETIRKAGVRVSCVSPGTIKKELTAEAVDEGLERLRRAIELARAVGAEMMILFSGTRRPGEEGGAQKRAVDVMRRMAQMCSEVGLRCAIENERSHYADSGAHVAALIEAVGVPGLGANWDPTNALGADEPYPAGYLAVKRHVVNVHFKDGRWLGDHVVCTPVGEGDIPWAEQLAALRRDGYDGYICIETHMEPRRELSERNLETLHKLLASLNPGGGRHR